PGLNALDYLFRGHIKALVYQTPVDDPQTLEARIGVASGELSHMPEYSSKCVSFVT
ncbi:hypothetical protein C0J52_24058, partial [Blattella germanica]